MLTTCVFAMSLICTTAVQANKEGCGTCHKACNSNAKVCMNEEIKKELCSKHYPAEPISCPPRISMHKVQEVVCKEVPREHPLCPKTITKCQKRIVNVPYEVTDYYDEQVCPCPQERLFPCCKKEVCACDGCKTCHTGRIHKEVKSEERAFERGYDEGFVKGEKAEKKALKAAAE